MDGLKTTVCNAGKIMEPSDNNQTNTPELTVSKQILLIEDEPFIGDLYSRTLKKAGYQVDIITDGISGLEKAKTNQYDIILLDIMIPQLLGIDVLYELRKIPGLKAKVIIATNLEQDQETRAKIEQQADAYIIKAEITPNQLAEFLKNF